MIKILYRLLLKRLIVVARVHKKDAKRVFQVSVKKRKRHGLRFAFYCLLVTLVKRPKATLLGKI